MCYVDWDSSRVSRRFQDEFCEKGAISQRRKILKKVLCKKFMAGAGAGARGRLCKHFQIQVYGAAVVSLSLLGRRVTITNVEMQLHTKADVWCVVVQWCVSRYEMKCHILCIICMHCGQMLQRVVGSDSADLQMQSVSCVWTRDSYT